MSSTVVANKKNDRNQSSESRFIKTAKSVIKNKLAAVGLVIIFLIVIAAIFAPILSSYGPNEQHLQSTKLGVGSEGHILGTDNYGRDMWSRIVNGASISLLVGICSVGIGLIGGIILGLLAGYYRKLDGIIMRIVDLLFAFPGILLAMLI